MADFAARIKAIRQNKRWTVLEFAERIGVHRQTIAGYEKGERYPDVRILSKIVEVTGCSAGYLLGVDNVMYNITPADGEREMLNWLTGFGLFYVLLNNLRLLSISSGSFRDILLNKCENIFQSIAVSIPEDAIIPTKKELALVNGMQAIIENALKEVEENEASR